MLKHFDASELGLNATESISCKCGSRRAFLLLQIRWTCSVLFLRSNFRIHYPCKHPHVKYNIYTLVSVKSFQRHV